MRGNGVVGDNDSGSDIYVFETGSNTELVDVQVAAGSPTAACPTTAASYTTVGRTTKDYGGVDIDDNGYGPSSRIFCVLIVDVEADLNNTSGGYHGAEIDAVGARSTYLHGDLSVGKTATPASANAGEDITYTITGRNLGSDEVSGATIADNLPANTALVSATPSQGTCTGTATVTCNFGSLAGGASATATLVVRPTADAAARRSPTPPRSPTQLPIRTPSTTRATRTPTPPATSRRRRSSPTGRQWPRTTPTT